MKQILTLSLITAYLFLGFKSTAQTTKAPGIQWQQCIQGKNYGYGQSMAITNDGGFVVVGFADSLFGGSIPRYHREYDCWIAKFDANRNLQWQYCYGGSGSDGGNTIEQTKDSGYIVTANTFSRDGDVKDTIGTLWIFKIDMYGLLQWEKRMGGTHDDQPYSVHQTFEGGYIMAAATSSKDGNVMGHHNPTGIYYDKDGWVIKFDTKGKVEWQICLGGSDDDRINDAQQTKDSGFIVTGATNSEDGDISFNHGRADAWVVKLNKHGKIEWSKCYGGGDIDEGIKILVNTDGSYIMGGQTGSNGEDISDFHGSYDYWLLKLDSVGTIIWSHCYGGSNYEFFYDLQPTIDHGYIIIGHTESKDGVVAINHGSDDYWIVKIDSLGKLNWQKCLGGTYGDFGRCIFQKKDSSYLVGGFSESFDGDVHSGYTQYDPRPNWWVVKLSYDTIPIINDTNITTTRLFPNPAHEYVYINTKDIVAFRLIDMLGKVYLSNRIDDNNTNSYLKLSIPFLAKGKYLIQTKSVIGKIRTEKLLVE